MHHLVGTSFSTTTTTTKNKTKQNTPLHRPLYISFLSVNFFSVCPSTPGKPGFTRAESLCPFPNEVPFLGSGSSEGPRAWGSGVVTAPRSLQPQPHVRAAGSIPLRGRGPVNEAPSGSRKKRTTVTVPEEPEQVGQSQALGSARPRVRRPFAEVAAGKGASAGSWGLGPSQRPAAPR